MLTFIILLFWVIFYLIFIYALSNQYYQIIAGIFFLTFGIFATIFNNQMYKYIILKWNRYIYRNVGAKSMGDTIMSNQYKIFYRTVTFLTGLFALYLGARFIFLYFGIDLNNIF